MSVNSEIQGKLATKEIPGGKVYLSVEPITTLYSSILRPEVQVIAKRPEAGDCCSGSFAV